MRFRHSLATILRQARLIKGLTQEKVSTVSRRFLSDVEGGKRDITLETLCDLSESLTIDPLTILVASVALETKQSTEDVLKRIRAELHSLEESNWLTASGPSLEEPVHGKTGRPRQDDNIRAVKKLKAAGLTQVQIVQELGLAPSVVHRHWHRKVNE